jgi:hypothetical protein
LFSGPLQGRDIGIAYVDDLWLHFRVICVEEHEAATSIRRCPRDDPMTVGREHWLPHGWQLSEDGRRQLGDGLLAMHGRGECKRGGKGEPDQSH